MFNILKLIGILVICLYLLGFAAEAATKCAIGALSAAFWGVVLLGFVGLASLFGKKGGGEQ